MLSKLMGIKCWNGPAGLCSHWCSSVWGGDLGDGEGALADLWIALRARPGG